MEEEKAVKGAKRDAKGRFAKGKGGSARTRVPLPPEFKEYAEKAPGELWAIAQDESTPVKNRAEILRWFAEMWYGKAPQALDLDGKVDTGGVQTVKFEGCLDEWSK